MSDNKVEVSFPARENHSLPATGVRVTLIELQGKLGAACAGSDGEELVRIPAELRKMRSAEIGVRVHRRWGGVKVTIVKGITGRVIERDVAALPSSFQPHHLGPFSNRARQRYGISPQIA